MPSALTLRLEKGSELTYQEMDDNFIYLQSLGGQTGPQGPAGENGEPGPQGPQGPAGSGGGVSYTQFATIATESASTSLATGGSGKFIKVPVVPTGYYSTNMGPADNHFGVKLGPSDHAYQVFASAEIADGNNKVLGMRLQMSSGAVIGLSQCSGNTGNTTNFAKLVTQWIITPDILVSNEEDVYITIANMSDGDNIIAQKLRMTVVDLGPVELF